MLNFPHKKRAVGHTRHYKQGIGVRYSACFLRDGLTVGGDEAPMIVAWGTMDADGVFYQWPDKYWRDCQIVRCVGRPLEGKRVIAYVPVSAFKDWPCMMVVWR